MAALHFLTLLDFAPEELNQLIERAIELKRMRIAGTVHQPLRNKTLAMVFELSSTRTRVAFEGGMQQLGGHAIFLSQDDTQLGRGEPIADTARVLSEMVDLIMVRMSDHADLEAFAAASAVPVINAMTARFHPCQLLADVQTFVELRGPIHGRQVAFVGDGYNMCNTYIHAARQFGFQLNVACPEGFEPDRALIDGINNVRLVKTPREAVTGADLVVTDVWSSMGHEDQRQERCRRFAPYQITRRLLDYADSEALFMHCLPAHRGEEVTDAVIDGPHSVVFDEAENRLHAQKAILLWCMGHDPRG
jgi:ornithine carbamoyltransferase